MTDEAFEKLVKELVAQGMPEPEARIRAGLEAGDGGDVQTEGEKPEDPQDVLDSLGDAWRPSPKE